MKTPMYEYSKRWSSQGTKEFTLNAVTAANGGCCKIHTIQRNFHASGPAKKVFFCSVAFCHTIYLFEAWKILHDIVSAGFWCSEPEEPVPEHKKQELIENQYHAGCIVWVKESDSKFFWPAIVDDCVLKFRYFKLQEGTIVPVSILHKLLLT